MSVQRANEYTTTFRQTRGTLGGVVARELYLV